ncbi:hypothetical protein WN55_00293 [Dufourea novaeangliae]|uniref:Uncharacterized protein n=1 Tax=Dufourea novaeangliae TaxID=178035 RepID=A0A154PAR8_DUFNO|nr:hypothetical protein WN55_00293 [Dufourea novaeangliae]
MITQQRGGVSNCAVANEGCKRFTVARQPVATGTRHIPPSEDSMRMELYNTMIIVTLNMPHASGAGSKNTPQVFPHIVVVLVNAENFYADLSLLTGIIVLEGIFKPSRQPGKETNAVDVTAMRRRDRASFAADFGFRFLAESIPCEKHCVTG